MTAVLNNTKRHKAPGLLGLVAKMIHATGDIGTQWILDLCNGIAIDRYKWRKMIKDVR